MSGSGNCQKVLPGGADIAIGGTKTLHPGVSGGLMTSRDSALKSVESLKTKVGQEISSLRQIVARLLREKFQIG